MRRLSSTWALLALVALAGDAWTQEAGTPARDLFAAVEIPTPPPNQAIGFYSGGCLAGGLALPPIGPHWQAVRPERNRNWGHLALIDYLQRLSEDAARFEGWPGLLVSDMSQPRGGPMPGAHVSHQTGLDVDLLYTPMPGRPLTATELQELNVITLVRPGTLEIDAGLWNEAIAALLRRAASYQEVDRIFVHPAIKQALCEWAGADRDWLRVIRPWYGHADHFHVRLRCPEGDATCFAQDPPPQGDGCGAELAWWLGPEPYRPPDGPPTPPPPPLRLADLPPACRVVLQGSGPTTVVPLPRPRP